MVNRRRNRALTFIFAALILLFSGGPVVLSLVGSLVPDRILLNHEAGLFDEGINIETYRYVFTGQLPEAYLAKGANRAMISDAARQVPQSLLNSSVIALSSMMLNLLLGAPAAFLFARYTFPGKKLSFMFLILSPLVPTVALVTPIYMTLQAMVLLARMGIILVHTAKLAVHVLISQCSFGRYPVSFRGRRARPLLAFSGIHPDCTAALALPPSERRAFAFMLSTRIHVLDVLSGDAATRPVSS